MKPGGSRRKGAQFERDVALAFRKAGYLEARRGLGQARGAEVCDVEGTPWWIEAKRYSFVSGTIIRKAWEQATRDVARTGDGRPKLIVFKSDFDEPGCLLPDGKTLVGFQPFLSAITRLPLVRGNSCILWEGARDTNGYGRLGMGGRDYRAHRLVLLLSGMQTHGGVILHSCDNPACINLNHLRVGTQKENRADSDIRGRSVAGAKSHFAKLQAEQVVLIKEGRLAGKSLNQLAYEFGVSGATVSRICTGVKWKHLGVSRVKV